MNIKKWVEREGKGERKGVFPLEGIIQRRKRERKGYICKLLVDSRGCLGMGRK